MNRVPHRFPKLFPIDMSITNHTRKINRTKITGLIGEERLFTARITGFHSPDFWCWVVSIDLVNEDYAGIAAHPSGPYHQVPDFLGFQLSCFFLVPWIDQPIGLVFFQRFYELVGYCHRDVEV